MTIEFSPPPALASFAEEPAPCEDAARYERLFTTHYLPVMRVCMRRLQDQSDAEDAVQEVFRRAVQAGADLEGDPLPWLVTVAKHVCLDELRRRRTGRAALERTAALSAGADAADSQVERNPERVVLGHMFVRDMLGRLTPAERRVMAARLFSGESGVETAQSLGVSSSTTRVLLARARQKLRTYLEEGQAVLGGAALYATRTLHSVRRRVLEPSPLQDRAATLFPAALLLTVMVAPGVAPSHGDHDSHSATAQAPVTWLHDAGGAATTLGLTPAARLVGGGGRSVASIADHGAGNGGARQEPERYPALPQLAAPDPDAVSVTDVEPSPEYSSDHTVYFIGNLSNCLGAGCAQLFKSTDGGATWSYLPARGLASAGYLVLPANAYAHNRFYAVTTAGLEITQDGGASFTPVMPVSLAAGFAAAAPRWSDLDVMVSNAAILWKVGQSLTPLPLSTVGVDRIARGPALLLPSATGSVALQPVTSASGLTGNDVEILHCSAGQCANPVPLPFTGTTTLIPSPHVLTDHTVVAWSGGSKVLAVSNDAGSSFRLVPSDTIARATRLTAVSGPDGLRLVASLFDDHGAADLAYSDDLGATWRHSAIDHSLGLGAVFDVIALGADRVIASSLRVGHPGYYGFMCSGDGGATWRACTPPHST